MSTNSRHTTFITDPNYTNTPTTPPTTVTNVPTQKGKTYKLPTGRYTRMSTTQTKTKAALIGRHRLLPSQETVIAKLGIEIVEQIAQVPTEPQQLQQFIEQLKNRGVQVLIVQALPIELLSQLLRHFTILFIKMQQVALVESEEEAQRLVQEAPEKRVAIPSAMGEKKTFRIMEFVGVTRVKKIVIEEEPVIQV